MYASFPFFLSINATYGGWLLAPVFEFASSPAWTYPYAPKDLGTLPRGSEIFVRKIFIISRQGHIQMPPVTLPLTISG